MKTHIETIRGNIAALERRLRRIKSPSARRRIAQTIGQWTFLLQRSDLLAAHTRKWSEVCNELEAMYPNANAMLYVHGYVFGLRHAVAIASRKPIGQV